MSVFRCALFGGLVFMLGACTRVSIHESDGRVRVVKGFGLIRIDAEPRSQPQLIQENLLALSVMPTVGRSDTKTPGGCSYPHKIAESWFG